MVLYFKIREEKPSYFSACKENELFSLLKRKPKVIMKKMINKNACLTFLFYFIIFTKKIMILHFNDVLFFRWKN